MALALTLSAVLFGVPLAASASPAPASSTTSTTTTSAPSPPPLDITAGAKKVSDLEAQLAEAQQHSEALSQRYDAILSQEQLLGLAIAKSRAQIASVRSDLKAAQERAAAQAIERYVKSSPSPAASALFTSNSEGPARTIYESTAFTDTHNAIIRFTLETFALTAQLATLRHLKAQAALESLAAAELLNQDRAAAATTLAGLAQAKGQLKDQMVFIAVETASADAAKGDAAGAAAAIAIAGLVGGPDAASAATAAANAAGGITVTGSPIASDRQDAAITAAISQIGTPYQFGAATPKKGFDCSGLVQWAWAAAGATIARTAADQWNSLPHVDLSSLQPGDLLFYDNLDGDHVVDHVVMWVGKGPFGAQTVIAAPHAGATVDYEPLFTQGLIGAARP